MAVALLGKPTHLNSLIAGGVLLMWWIYFWSPHPFSDCCNGSNVGWNIVSTWLAVTCHCSVSHRGHLVSARGDVAVRLPGRKPLSVPTIHRASPFSYTLLTAVQPPFCIFSISLEHAGIANFGLILCCSCLGRWIFQLKRQRLRGNLGSFGLRSEGAGQLANTERGERGRKENLGLRHWGPRWFVVEAETGASDAETGGKQYKSRVAQGQRESDKGKRKTRLWISESWIQAQREQLKRVKKLREPLGGRGAGHDSWKLGKAGVWNSWWDKEPFTPRQLIWILSKSIVQ